MGIERTGAEDGFHFRPGLFFNGRDRGIDQLRRVKPNAPQPDLAGNGKAQPDECVTPPARVGKEITNPPKLIHGLCLRGGSLCGDPSLRLFQPGKDKNSDERGQRAQVVKSTPSPTQFVTRDNDPQGKCRENVPDRRQRLQ